MYEKISQLLMYGDLTEKSILYQLGRAIDRINSSDCNKTELIKDIHAISKRLLMLATDYGFDDNLWHNYLTFYIITNENPFQNRDTNNNLLTINNDTNIIGKKIKNKILVFKEKNDFNADNLKRMNSNSLNKSMNNNIKKHMKFNSMKLEENLWNQFNKKQARNLYLKTNENFFKHEFKKI